MHVDAIEAPALDRLRALGVPFTLHRHPPVHTVAASQALRGEIPGVHVKNLLVRDKKRTCWLVVVPEDRDVDLKALREPLDSRGTLSFASADLLAETLRLEPGGVTPLGVVHDTDARVTLVLDRALLAAPVLCCHPLHNAATVALASADLVRFAEACGHPPLVIDVPGP